jgi:fused signal recognition particle receptor
MVFNWFRREYDEENPQAEQEAPLVETPVENSVEAKLESTEPGTNTQSEDLLNWAKSAYANIQKQQAPVAADVTNNITETENIVEPPAEPAPLATLAPTTETVAAPETEPETITAIVSEEPEIAEVPESPELNTETSQPEPSAVLPFWAQSERDRQARIDALAASAIAEPEIAPPPKPIKTFKPIEVKSTPAEMESAIAFDEGFLWSAEVLAAQGRKPENISVEEITWLKQLRQGLGKTRLGLVNQLKSLVGQGPLNADAVDEIEALLLQADVGVAATDRIIEALQNKLRTEVLPPEAGIAFLKKILCQMLDAPLQDRGNLKFNLAFVPTKNQLNIWLMTGVNGAGKTTTIGKIAHIAQKSGYRTLIAAADTFRAAAVQQVKVWGDRAQVEVIANIGQNTDPASVVFDAIIAAQARGTELLLVDTAGRLQNKKNLMDELHKIRRIVDKKASGATVESLLVLDATLGQNGLRQAEVFAQAAGVSGVVLTKLDGTAKGGVALAVVQQLGLPIRFIGAGEGIEDLRPFSSYEFVEALLSS